MVPSVETVYPERAYGSGHGIWRSEPHGQGMGGSSREKMKSLACFRKRGLIEARKKMSFWITIGICLKILRKERKRLADLSGIPPYVIFSDKSLVEMATYFPQSDGCLLDIHGVGTVKQKKYGTVFLPIIREYCSLHHIEERIKSTRRDKKKDHHQ